MKKVLLILSVLLIFIGIYKLYTRVTIINIPSGELKWSKQKPKHAKLCIPAAFSTINNTVVGSYRIKGKSYNNDKKYCTKISLIDNTFIINKSWKSDNGFQQILLVKNNIPVKFKGSVKKCFRRALGKNENKTFLIESNYPMTMSVFANYCSKYCSDAVYLDMGEYGYGYIKNGLFTKHLYFISFVFHYKQTNWLYIE